ncbi:MAG: efflux RND transporter periplasmic adaptor subunit [Acidobacteriota bacterium]
MIRKYNQFFPRGLTVGLVQRLALGALLILLPVGCGSGHSGDEHHGSENASEEHAHHDEHDDEHGHDEHGDEHGRDEHDEHGHDEHGHDEHGEEGVIELSPEAVERIGLTTELVTPRPISGLRTTTATLGYDEERLAHVAPRVDGRLLRVPTPLGGSVRAGQTLALLDAQALGEARAEFLRARARQELAQRGFEREQSLRADRISSEQELLEAEAEAREANADLAAARDALRLLGLSGSAIDALSWEDPSASKIALRAPFAGKVVHREATVGELVSPSDTLFTIADLSHLWLWIDLYERDLAHVALGDRAEVRLGAWPGEVFAGAVDYIADEVDPASRTLRARLDLPNPEGRFKPGMFARVALAVEEQPDSVLTVSRQAIQRDGGASIVFVRTEPGRFERREVLVGQTTDLFAEIVDGLGEGEEVVTAGGFLLRSQASADELGGHHHH